jgi:hypothetical protein
VKPQAERRCTFAPREAFAAGRKAVGQPWCLRRRRTLPCFRLLRFASKPWFIIVVVPWAVARGAKARARAAGGRLHTREGAVESHPDGAAGPSLSAWSPSSGGAFIAIGAGRCDAEPAAGAGRSRIALGCY